MCPRSRQRRPSSAEAAEDGIRVVVDVVLDVGLDVEMTGGAAGGAAIAAVLAAKRYVAELYFDAPLTHDPASDIWRQRYDREHCHHEP
jgi:hypothetical protein